MIAMILGVGMYGYIIGNVASLLARLDTAKASYRARMERLSGFLHYRKVPLELRQRIFDYYLHP